MKIINKNFLITFIYRQNSHQSIINNNNDSGDQHIPSRDALFRTLSNPGNIVRRVTSWGFNLRQTLS